MATHRSQAPEESAAATLPAALLRRLVAESPIIDRDRVSRIVEEVRSGAYRCDPGRIAEKLIGMELLLP
jgi:anti-sigma28 factor (negative regulator of flagellin synthesis)